MCINTFKNKLGRALAGFLCIVLLAGGMIQTVYAVSYTHLRAHET